MTRKEFNKLVNIHIDSVQKDLEQSNRTLLQDIKALEVSKKFYQTIVSKLKTRGKFYISCFAAVVAIEKMIGMLNESLAQQADIAIDAGEFSGRFW
jgi:hypothetical protein